MKRAVAYLVAVTLLLVAMTAFAQTQAAQPASAQSQGYPKDAYVKNIPLIRVFVHPLGYELVYWKSDMTIGYLYVPLAWFRGGLASTANITYGSNPERPYVTISWVDGKFDHISINAQSDMMGPTWGTLGPTVDLTSQFNIQEPPRDY